MTLVLGLVMVPTSCDCGAGVPHGHSLFVLAGHHHSGGEVVFGADESDGHGHHGHEVEGASASGTQIMGRISHASDRVALALPHILMNAESWQRFSPPFDVAHPGEGRVDTPEFPPPRTSPQL